MKETKMMDNLVESLRQRLSGKTLLAAVPAIIGLIPMPGGALFSAPLVEDCDKEKSIDPYIKTKINYWFRHIWEFWFPLYAGVILAIQITGLELWQLAAINFPLTAFMALGGYIFLLRKVSIEKTIKQGKKTPIFKYIYPIASIILFYGLISFAVPQIKSVSTYFPIGIGIFLTIILTQALNPLPAKKWIKIVFTKNIGEMVLLIGIIGIYAAFLKSQLPNGMYLMDIMKDELSSAGIPLSLLTIILPMASGFATGLATGFVGTSFPIVFALLGKDPALGALLSTAVIAYASGHIGQILSPVHVCNIVSNKFFKTDLLRATAQLLPICLFIFLGAAFSVAVINAVF
jgi:integral membrane protein (TIGR00529 family)